jgi:endonuclease YncB( thermonuclease family)
MYFSAGEGAPRCAATRLDRGGISDAPYNRLRNHADAVQPADWEIILARPKGDPQARLGGQPMRGFLLGALLAMALAGVADAQTSVVGVASVIDGDTIEIHGQRIRLFGVDAPESRQICVDAAGRDWHCGQRAALELSDMIGRATVLCEQRDWDRYRRMVAVCRRGGQDIGRWLAVNGWAVAYRRYSVDYVHDEEVAHQANRGIWASRFEMPWDWRADHRGR